MQKHENIKKFKENSTFIRRKFLQHKKNKTVNEILDLIDNEEYKEIIINDFVFKDNTYWWMKKYSRSTYYRNKKKAMEEVIFFLT